MNKIKCLICNKYFSQITHSHLKKQHNLTVKQYKEMFPNCEIMTQSTRKFLSDKAKIQNLSKNFGFKNGHQVNKNKKPWNKGLTKLTDSRVKKLSEKLKGRKFSEIHRWNISKSRKLAYAQDKIDTSGPKNGMYGRKLSAEHLEKLLKSSRYHRKINKVEQEAYKTLIQYGFKYTGDGSFWLKFKNLKYKNPDFINEQFKMAVEIFGDYWHKGEDPNDLIKLYKEIGWTCYVIWEHEVVNGFGPEAFEQILGIFEPEEFSYYDFDGSWMN